MPRIALLLLILLCCCTAVAQVQSLGHISFAVPEGWNYEGPSDEGARVTMTQGDGSNIAVIALFRGIRSSGDADADFRSAWAQCVRSMEAPQPIYEHKSLVGYSGRYGSTNTPDGSQYVHLYVLEAGSYAVPVLIVTANRQKFNAIEPVVSQFVEGIRIAPKTAEPPKTGIAMADLVGEWHSGGESSLNYVTPSGAYAGSSTVAHGATYTISANGSYTSQFAGVSNRNIIRGHSAGIVELGQGFVGFRERSGNRVTRYRLISCQTAINGSTVLTLLADQYEASAANIGFYAEKWVRDAPNR